MKLRRLMTVVLAIMMLSIMQVSAQSQKGQNQRGDEENPLTSLNLSEKQETQAKEFHSQMKEKITPIQLDVKEKEIQLQKLMIADEIDESAVFAKVDEISALKAEIQKARLLSKIQIRSILTKDQRIKFDEKAKDRKKGEMKPQNKTRRQTQ
jgi:Spy/CpxP family protein refolding chaperone